MTWSHAVAFLVGLIVVSLARLVIDAWQNRGVQYLTANKEFREDMVKREQQVRCETNQTR